MTFPKLYRAAETRSGGACPIEAGVIGRLADHECRHERLPGDRTPACGCWPQENEAPDLMGVFHNATRKEETVEIPTPAEPAVHAPFGFKADGTPRKRPAPAPATIAKAHAARRTNLEHKPATHVAASVATIESPFLAQMLGQLDAEITRLQVARERISEALAA